MTANTPPAMATSSPKKITRSSRASSSSSAAADRLAELDLWHARLHPISVDDEQRRDARAGCAAAAGSGRLGAVDDAVVARQRDVHQPPRDDPAVGVTARAQRDLADREDRRLRMVDDGVETPHAEHAEVRDGEGAVGEVLAARSTAPRTFSARRRDSAAISNTDFSSASRIVGTRSASSVATATPTLTRP